MKAFFRRKPPAAAEIHDAETTEAYRARMIEEIVAELPDGREAIRLMRRAIDALPDAEDRAHAPLHEVRYLMTYAMVPAGPGTVVELPRAPSMPHRSVN